jgi:hypothetical protein
MLVTFETAGKKVTVEVSDGAQCSELKQVLEGELGRDLSKITLYNRDTNDRLEDSDFVVARVLGVKSKNESALSRILNFFS